MIKKSNKLNIWELTTKFKTLKYSKYTNYNTKTSYNT